MKYKSIKKDASGKYNRNINYAENTTNVLYVQMNVKR